MPTRLLHLALSVALAAPLGCGGGADRPQPPVPTAGTVTLDGKPLAEGTIDFLARGAPPRQFPIKDGKFDGGVPPGSYEVQIRAYREMASPPKPDPTGPGGPPDTREQYLPARYNNSSELKATVPATGPLVFALAGG